MDKCEGGKKEDAKDEVQSTPFALLSQSIRELSSHLYVDFDDTN